MKVVAIVGRGPSWKDCPFDCETWGTISCLSVEGLKHHHFERIFTNDPLEPDLELLKYAESKGIRVISTSGGYGTEKYPWDAIVKDLQTNFLQNTASFMIAYAIWAGYKRICLYGIDQSGPGYFMQNPIIQYWIGFARGIAKAEGRSCWDALQFAPTSQIMKYAMEMDKEFVEV